MLVLYMFMDFPGGSDGKESAFNAGDLGLIPGWEDPLEKELQYSCLENSTDREAWQFTVHGVANSRTRLSNFHFHLRMFICHYCFMFKIFT